MWKGFWCFFLLNFFYLLCCLNCFSLLSVLIGYSNFISKNLLMIILPSLMFCSSPYFFLSWLNRNLIGFTVFDHFWDSDRLTNDIRLIGLRRNKPILVVQTFSLIIDKDKVFFPITHILLFGPAFAAITNIKVKYLDFVWSRWIRKLSELKKR